MVLLCKGVGFTFSHSSHSTFMSLLLNRRSSSILASRPPGRSGRPTLSVIMRQVGDRDRRSLPGFRESFFSPLLRDADRPALYGLLGGTLTSSLFAAIVT